MVDHQQVYYDPQTGGNVNLGPIQRPESMTVPIGGVWRPDDSDAEETLFPEEEDGDAAAEGDKDKQGQGADGFGFAQEDNQTRKKETSQTQNTGKPS